MRVAEIVVSGSFVGLKNHSSLVEDRQLSWFIFTDETNLLAKS